MQQLTQWAMIHPERIRDKMEEQRDTEQTDWVGHKLFLQCHAWLISYTFQRIEPYGWDSKDRTYYVLDDNRVYRLSESHALLQSFASEKSSTRGGRQSNKRRRLNRSHESDKINETSSDVNADDNGLGGMKWECVAVTLPEVQSLVQALTKTRDKNEQILKQQLQEHLVPILEKQEESRKRKELQREKELMNLAKMANAKRSSRIAGKVERQKQEEVEKEEEERSKAAETARKREEQERFKLERERDSRLASREQRLKEREARRLQHEEELATLSEDSSKLAGGKARMSERRRQAEIAKNREALKQLEDEEDWVFDCICGMYGHVDDGTHSVACEKCNVWQHSKCLGITERDADRPDFHFVCSMCRSRENSGHEKPRTTIKLKVHHPGESDVTQAPATNTETQIRAPSLSVDFPSVSHHSPQKQQSSSPTSRLAHKDVNGVVLSNISISNGEKASKLGSERIKVKPNVTHVLAHPDVGTENSSRGVAVTPSASHMKDFDGFVSPLFQGLQAKQQAMASPGNVQALSTPKVEKNGFPARAGISPTKQSPRPLTPVAGLVGATPTVIPPVTTLSPTSREIILTPPTKSSPPRSPVKSSPPRSFVRSSPPRSPVKSSPPRPTMAAD